MSAEEDGPANIYAKLFSAGKAPELALALGDMILAWTLAETEQMFLFGSLLQITLPQASRLFAQYGNFHLKTQALLTLIDLNAEYEIARPFVSKLSELSKTRNGLVHGHYQQKLGGEEIRVVRHEHPEGSRYRSRPIKPHDIKQHAEAVRKCAAEFHKLRYEIPGFGKFGRTFVVGNYQLDFLDDQDPASDESRGKD